jgi:hypothetical protein
MVQSSQQIAVQGPYATPCFTSGCTWMRAKGVARTVLANPASGPGTKSDPNWARMVTEMRSAGTLMLGYVYTSTSTRAAATVKSEISKYFQWYPTISGVFIDQVSTACDKLPYYQGLVTHVRGLNPNAVVVFNWGSGGWVAVVRLWSTDRLHSACATAHCLLLLLYCLVSFVYIYHVVPSGLQPMQLLHIQPKAVTLSTDAARAHCCCSWQ